MIVGIGTDIVKIDRIRSAHTRLGDAFLRRVFAEGELRYCMSRANPYPSLAARFAAKEALIKALPHGGNLFVSDIAIEADAEGAPRFELTPKVRSALESLGVRRAHLSLTHEKEYAVAFVVIEAMGRGGE
jgi:holo-[acyl-carrier protein] synthase